jgi:hypothetical protein
MATLLLNAGKASETLALTRNRKLKFFQKSECLR